MTNKVLLAAGAAVMAGGLQAQTMEKNVAFQYFFNNEVATTQAVPAFRYESVNAKPVAGRPFSATELRRTRQTLGDGTHIDKTDTNKYYRDGEGRTRIERENGASVMVSDPQTGATAETSNGKSHMIMRSGSFNAAAADRTVTVMPPPEVQKDMLEKMSAERQVQGRTMIAGAVGGTIGTAVAGGQNVFTRIEAAPAAMPLDRGAVEDLGDQIVNGVMAHGARTTLTIPQGQIGNDREIKVVSERWYSNDLQMLIKSSNNDPRFGETTYEMTNILQGAQDPTLFQMPSNMKH